MSKSSAFDCSMAMGTIGDQIAQSICLYPVVVKLAPRSDMVNIQRASKSLFSSAAFLTSVTISLACFIALLVPIGAAPLVMAAFPVAMILAFLPSRGAFVGAEPGILAAINNVFLNLNSFAALPTGEQSVSCLRLASTAAISGVGMLIARARHIEYLSARFAGNGYSIPLGLMGTFLGAKAVFAIVIVGKLFAAYLADLRGIADGLTETLARAVPLSRAMGPKFFSTNRTSFHTTMIPHPGACVKIRIAGGSVG